MSPKEENWHLCNSETFPKSDKKDFTSKRTSNKEHFFDETVKVHKSAEGMTTQSIFDKIKKETYNNE